jgi:membrane protein
MLAGLLFFANVLFKSIETVGGGYLEKLVKGGSIYFRLAFSEVSSVIIVAAWFIVLFRFLADGRPTWKAAITGGLLTGLLYTAGRMLFKAMFTDSNIGKLYGPAGSFVLVLLFVFYTSLIMYYGACFIKVFSDKMNWSFVHDQFVTRQDTIS